MSEYNEDVVDEVFEDADDLEDNPLYSALTEEPDSDESEDEDEEFDPQEGDSVEVQNTKLAAKNRLLRQKDKSNQRMKDRIEELETKLNDGSGGLSKQDLADVIQAAKGGEDTSDAEEQTRIQELKDRLEEDPSAIVDILGQSTLGIENKLAQILQSRDAYWEEKFAAQSSQKAQETPEITRLVGLLEQKEQYKNVDRDTLVQFAKDLAPLGTRVSGKRPPAAVSGSRVLPFDAKQEQVEKTFKSELDRMGYSEDND